MHTRFTPVRLAIAAAVLAFGSHAQAQNAPIKVGLMLPATGTFANLGTMIENGFKMYVAATRCSTSRWTTSRTRPRPPTTSTS